MSVKPTDTRRGAAPLAPEKIAILGGGVGSMAAAWYLSSQPLWQERYDITVYQQGWRLGGKGASGRNAGLGQRIEEHGLHIWFGFYANAFSLMREVYERLDRPAGSPLASLQDAFRPHDYVVMSELVDQEWRHWNVVFPPVAGEPGTGGAPLTLWQMALALLGWVRRWLGEARTLAPQAAPAPELAAELSLDALLAALPPDSRAHTAGEHELIARQVAALRASAHANYRAIVIGADALRRRLILIDTASTVLKGMFADGVLRNGFDAINGVDLRAWLARHGGDPDLCVGSAPVRACYDLMFAYLDGDAARPDLEAGTGLRAVLRIMLGYKGSIMFKMQAGMGDTVFAPLYQVLAARGVKFRFFHQVDELVPDGATVGSIRMTVQASPGALAYDPLVTVRDLACWPSRPLYEQLDPAQAALLRENDVDLESWWSDWPALHQQHLGRPLPVLTLLRGRDFDKVVFGISAGALAPLCPQLVERSAPLQAAAGKLRTVATQACQFWLNRDLAQLGWTEQPGGQQPVLSAFSEPFDTWAPLDQLIEREDWPPAHAPRTVSYFCSPMPLAACPPRSDSGFPARCAAQARAAALRLLGGDIAALWPATGPRGAFPWHWLVDPQGASGPARFERQYWRANIDPSERYVLSAAGTTGYRPGSAGSGFSNLYLAGDWLKTGLDAGCVEAAVMGGMQAARAIGGHPARIEGETDF